MLTSETYLTDIRLKKKILVRDFYKLQSIKNAIITYSCNGTESIVFGSNFRNGDFDGFTRYEDS